MSTKHHNDGQEDAQDNKYDAPHGVGDELTTWSKAGMERNNEENQDYRDGWYHGRGQHDASEGKYDPPSDTSSHRKEKYDEGWHGTNDEKESKSGCFLSSACVNARHLPDDCETLGILRRFRDKHVAKTAGGPQLLAEYYATAPAIVTAINCNANPAVEWETIFQELQQAVSLIGKGHADAAVSAYKGMFQRLQRKYAAH